LGDPRALAPCDDSHMTTDSLSLISNAAADAVERAAAGVVQVHGRRRPASGLVHSEGIVVTTTRALGREDGLHVRNHEGTTFDAQLAGWDPTTSLAVLRVAGLTAPPLVVSAIAPRVGHFAIAIARSWSNHLTASAGIIAVIGGPLPTGRRRAIEQVLRTTAPMHDGFAGGAFVDTAGELLGVATASEIRGLGVVIPASIAWSTAAHLLEHGGVRRGYLGIAGQPVTLAAAQQALAGRDDGLLITGVTDGSPAAAAGVLVGDVLFEFEGRPVDGPETLLDLLSGAAPGTRTSGRLLRGASVVEAAITIGDRPTR
jgi:S1-C subfamily serine protease